MNCGRELTSENMQMASVPVHMAEISSVYLCLFCEPTGELLFYTFLLLASLPKYQHIAFDSCQWEFQEINLNFIFACF